MIERRASSRRTPVQLIEISKEIGAVDTVAGGLEGDDNLELVAGEVVDLIEVKEVDVSLEARS